MRITANAAGPDKKVKLERVRIMGVNEFTRHHEGEEIEHEGNS